VTPAVGQGGAPGEFRYWANLGRPWVRAVRAAGRALGFDPAPPDDVVRAFAAMYYDADPAAEAFVDEVYRGRGAAAGRALLDAALEGGLASIEDPPPSLIRLLADVERDPPWVDHALVERGARAFRRFGPAIFRFAGTVTLAAYAESSVAKPLALTGGYAGSSARHRFLETVAFWIAVSEPGGLAPGAPGRASALRVRVMHVFVRRRLLAHPEWDLAAWGVPISQADAMLTLMGGSFAPGLAMRAMGFLPSRRDVEAMMHFWRYVGHLMGVRPRWYPASLREAAQLAFVAAVKGAGRAGDDGVRLCQSYARAFAPPPDARGRRRLRALLSDRVHKAYTRFFLPPSVHRANRLPPAGPWALIPLAQAPFILAAEAARRTVGLDGAADRYARWRRDRWFAHHMAGRRAEYRPAERFTR
jgi:ER-bound oxygenase mpaB/B'/Rubber oxygenase, catalytic domain